VDIAQLSKRHLQHLHVNIDVVGQWNGNALLVARYDG
jgi:hypothetical protein